MTEIEIAAKEWIDSLEPELLHDCDHGHLKMLEAAFIAGASHELKKQTDELSASLSKISAEIESQKDD